ncbi:MAG TPA: hypothetical protein VJ785_07885 [Anaerolineales bacterium]|nr:hypothetical protein [Anaerolineales bacterium]
MNVKGLVWLGTRTSNFNAMVNLYRNILGLVAISENLPTEFGGSSTGLPITQDLPYGMGTAISPPLYIVIIQLVLLMLAPRKGHWGTFRVLGLASICSDGLVPFDSFIRFPVQCYK